ncbi:cytochrome b [Rouxiella badensis]|uniref:cytochrome b n=1 Tax=Rouxiella badensis TaxID=1646377 RepID=UPI001788173B|nr:cytochrome b/b6 domain-containing protein [Rouxiella badensis]QOI56929.1 cytochrome b [Rouxiella badensis subsp. acadiensis]
MKNNPLSPSRKRYDHLTLLLHWLTAWMVIFLFASAHIWEVLERGTPLRKALQSLHISTGILLAMVIVWRLLWRIMHPARLDAIPMPTAMLLLSKLTHWALYALLLAQISLGFLFRWAQGEPFYFFSVFPIPDVFGIDSSLRRTFGMLHNNVAWALIVLAGLHALAALFHHYVLRDGTLRRMLSSTDKEAP